MKNKDVSLSSTLPIAPQSTQLPHLRTSVFLHAHQVPEERLPLPCSSLTTQLQRPFNTSLSPKPCHNVWGLGGCLSICFCHPKLGIKQAQSQQQHCSEFDNKKADGRLVCRMETQASFIQASSLTLACLTPLPERWMRGCSFPRHKAFRADKEAPKPFWQSPLCETEAWMWFYLSLF